MRRRLHMSWLVLTLCQCAREGPYGDRCAVDSESCAPDADCLTTDLGKRCLCHAGYEGDGSRCTDVDECTLGVHDCSADGVCINTAGGFLCRCLEGLVGDGRLCHPRSCARIKEMHPEAEDGAHVINTGVGGPVQVHCDMTSDGGVGHTMVRFDDASLADVPDAYRQLCAAHGMDLIVPRSRAHARAILTFNGGDPPNLVGVYPQYGGARGLGAFEGRCQGMPCSFWLSDSNSADCRGFQPDGNNGIRSALYRTADGCDFGTWNDVGGEGRVQFVGSVICATNDAHLEPRDSCLSYLATDTLFNTAQGGIDGVYPLQAGGRRFDAYCDMTHDGGGWTLALKADGRATTFRYDSPYWTEDETYRPEAANLDETEAKLEAFNILPFAEARLGIKYSIDSGSYRYLRLPRPQGVAGCDAAGGCTLLDLFRGAHSVATGRSVQEWLDLVPGTVLQPQQIEGWNAGCAQGDPAARVRIGVVGDDAAPCAAPASRLGIGGAGSGCGMAADNTVGSTAGLDCPTADGSGPVDLRALGVLLIR